MNSSARRLNWINISMSLWSFTRSVSWISSADFIETMSEPHCTPGSPSVPPFQLSKHEKHACCLWSPDMEIEAQKELVDCSRPTEWNEAGVHSVPVWDYDACRPLYCGLSVQQSLFSRTFPQISIFRHELMQKHELWRMLLQAVNGVINDRRFKEFREQNPPLVLLPHHLLPCTPCS